MGIPIAQLRQKVVKNVEELDKLADNVDIDELNQRDLTEARNHLLRKKVGAQKLALAAINSNHQIAKMKAILRMSDHGAMKINSKIEEAIKANLDRIANLKDAINQVENENTELAKQNDVFRAGALDGI